MLLGNKNGQNINPATEESLINIYKACGRFTTVNEGVLDLSGAVEGQNTIILSTSEDCDYFQFWLDSNSTDVRVSAMGEATLNSPKYEYDLGIVTMFLNGSPREITIYNEGDTSSNGGFFATGNLNWRTGN